MVFSLQETRNIFLVFRWAFIDSVDFIYVTLTESEIAIIDSLYFISTSSSSRHDK